MLFLAKPEKVVEFEGAEGDKISMTLVRPPYAMAQELLAISQVASAELLSVSEESTKREQVAASAAFIRALPPAAIEAIFSDYVRDVQGFENDEGPVTLTGAELLRQCPDESLVMFVMTELRAMCKLGKAKPSRSSSASTSEPEGDRSPSTAAPTEGCDATASTTAPEPTTAESAPSSSAD
jgi:hypothetical protein